jgi:outer membrane protein assembly factor BamD
MKKYFYFLLIVVLTSCGEYQKLLKSTDAELKYTKAVEYFEKGDFMRAQTLFDEVAFYYKGTERSELVLNYLARAYMGQKDYYSASEYYKTYTRTYPKGQFVAESKFMIGYCYYLDSPDARLDQDATRKAINAFQEFIDVYPDNERVPETVKLMDEMADKLAYKGLLNAKLYYNLGNYLGNNYESAILTAQNTLRKFPSTGYREDLSFVILESKYTLATQSYEEKLLDRYRDTLDEYYSFINEFPDGKYKRQAERIFRESKKIVKD